MNTKNATTACGTNICDTPQSAEADHTTYVHEGREYHVPLTQAPSTMPGAASAGGVKHTHDQLAHRIVRHEAAAETEHMQQHDVPRQALHVAATFLEIRLIQLTKSRIRSEHGHNNRVKHINVLRNLARFRIAECNHEPEQHACTA